MKTKTITIIAAIFLAALSLSAQAQERQLHIITTGDQHGAWFSEPYVDGQDVKTSLMSVMYYVDSLRKAVGKDNVMLLDAGDCLQGDNAAYYFNYVEPGQVHLFSRISDYMGFDVSAVGNHDIETGHDVYDKVYKELKARNIPWLAANAVKEKNGKPYFPEYKIFKRGGLKVAVLGFTNPNMKAWLSEEVWKGIDFLSLTEADFVQKKVDKVIKKEKPDVVVVLTHSGTGEGDGEQLESQGLDLLNSLRCVDVLVCAHDHRPVVIEKNGCVLVNGGARGANVGHAVVTVKKNRKISSKTVEAKLVRMDKNKVHEGMQKKFAADFEAVKAFTNQKVGSLEMDMRTRDAYRGMSDYINLVHTVQLQAKEAVISFAAPLTFNGTVKAGELIYNDMFTIYPFENQLFVVSLKGKEIKDYLEYSYDTWIQTSDEHVLRITSSPDPRTGSERWSFVGRSYNFDSAAGISYTVDVTKPAGSRVNIISLADGSAFDPEASYNVAMTSYRASGGGNLLFEGAGLSKEEADSRVVAKYPEIRDLVYDYVKKHKTLTSSLVGDTSVLGEWRFVPEAFVAPLMEKDMKLIF